MTYLDFRLSGTSTGTYYVLAFDGAGTTASVGQVWTESFWASYVAGSLTNISASYIDQRFLSAVDTAFTLTTTLTRVSAVVTAPAATTVYVPALLLSYPVTAAIDITLRIGLPQADLASFTSSAIATTTAAATRAADNLTLDLTQLPNLQTPAGYGAALEFSTIDNNQPSVVYFGASIDTDSNNTWYLRNDTVGGSTARISSWVAGAANSSGYLPLRAAPLTNRAAFSVTPAGIRWVLNGSAVTNLARAGLPVMTNMVVGRMPWGAASAVAAMHATTVTLIPGPQSDAWLSEMAY